MVKRIKQLSPQVANQIAAGEVIERPASVVKELLENALDAGAHAIALEINFGGLNLIRISDNGHGIYEEDLPLAIAAHATSKIQALIDLYSIQTMGFRGEALASIASVAKLTIISKPENQSCGARLEHQDNHYSIIPHPRATGTTIEVQDLFFNTPVRKKFLKSEMAEFKAIETVVKKFALGSPHIAITLKHNQKEIFTLPAAISAKTELARIRKIFGKTFLENAGFLEVERAGITLRGWISGESDQRSQNDKQWFYINNRMIKDKLLQHAIKQAYQDKLFPGKHPSCLLFLTMASNELDVNVHPTKHEVRFQDPRIVHDLILSETTKILNYEVSQPQQSLIHANVLKETYVKRPLPHYQMHNEAVGEIKSITSNYVLYFEDNCSLLINLPHLLQEKICKELMHCNFPLPQRSLLVPIKFKAQINSITPNQIDLLLQIGIEIQVGYDEELLIRTIPRDFPYFNLNQFLVWFFKKERTTLEEIKKGFSYHQEINAGHLAEEEKHEMLLYIQSNLSQAKWCVLLDENSLQMFFPKELALDA